MMGALKASFGVVTPRKVAGLVPALVAVGYVGFALATGGIVNPKAPKTWDDIAGNVETYQASKQSADKLLADSKSNRDAVKAAIFQQVLENALEKMDSRVQEHRAIVQQRQAVPDGMVADLKQFYREELAKIPDDCRVAIAEAQARTILYAPGESYEILASSKLPVEKVFDAYMKKVVDQKWLMGLSRYDKIHDTGMIFATHLKRTLIVVVHAKPTFPGNPTTVYWSLEKSTPEEEFSSEDEE